MALDPTSLYPWGVGVGGFFFFFFFLVVFFSGLGLIKEYSARCTIAAKSKGGRVR